MTAAALFECRGGASRANSRRPGLQLVSLTSVQDRGGSTRAFAVPRTIRAKRANLPQRVPWLPIVQGGRPQTFVP
jgi:hypothetical protein